jgi:HEPN domain-containing protein
MNTRAKSAKEMMKNIDPKHVGWTVMHYLVLAYDDYVAARVLLNNKLALQGLILASTSVEKYLKAILATKGKISRIHLDSSDFLKLFEINDLDISNLNANFIKYLGRSYPFRYIEPTSGPTSITIEPRKLLAELDFTVSQCEASFHTRPVQSPYVAAVSSRDERVWANNYVLNEIDKNSFISEPADVLCTIVQPMTEIVPLVMFGFRSSNNGDFDFPIGRLSNLNQVAVEFSPDFDARHSFSAMRD